MSQKAENDNPYTFTRLQIRAENAIRSTKEEGCLETQNYLIHTILGDVKELHQKGLLDQIGHVVNAAICALSCPHFGLNCHGIDFTDGEFPYQSVPFTAGEEIALSDYLFASRTRVSDMGPGTINNLPCSNLDLDITVEPLVHNSSPPK